MSAKCGHNCAAVRPAIAYTVWRNPGLKPDFDFLRAENWQTVTPALKNVHTNKLIYRRLHVFELEARVYVTDRQAEGRARLVLRPVRTAVQKEANHLHSGQFLLRE